MGLGGEEIATGNWRNLYTVQVYMYRYSKYLHKRACFLKRFLKLFLIWCTVSLKFVLISELLTLTGLIITALIITKCQCNWTIENNIICCMDWLFVLYCVFPMVQHQTGKFAKCAAEFFQTTIWTLHEHPKCADFANFPVWVQHT